MRKLIAILASSLLLCIGAFTGTYASAPVPDPRVHATELRMFAPAEATCIVDTVATTHVVVLQLPSGPVAPAGLIAADGGIEYLAMLRSMTCSADWPRRLVSYSADFPKPSGRSGLRLKLFQRFY